MENKKQEYEVSRTIIEYYYVKAISKKEALQIVGDQGGPARVIVKNEKVKIRDSKA